MDELVWLFGMYYGEFVTVSKAYVKKLWKDLGRMRCSPFLEFSKSREYLFPQFFFLKPAENATVLRCFDNVAYGLPDIAYEAIEGTVLEKGKLKKGGIRVLAKGVVEGKLFVVNNVPLNTLFELNKHVDEKGRGICVLALTNAFPDKETYGCSRTGTFFNYEIREKYIVFEPLFNKDKGNYLVGKGVIYGAWPHLKGLPIEIGGMNESEYEREVFCPLTIGGSGFKKDGSEFRIVYRGVKTDLRFDMPAAILFVKKAKGFERLAENLGISISYAFGRYLEFIFQRNILADGNIVDYDNINGDHRKIKFNIKKNKEMLNLLVRDVFDLLFICALVSVFEETAFEALKDQEKFLVLIDNEERFEAVKKRYHALRVRFMDMLKKNQTAFFHDLDKFACLFSLDLEEGWHDKREE